VRGIDVTEDSVSLEAMREVCLGGPGPLSRPSPDIERDADRICLPSGRRPTSPKEWVEIGKPDLVQKAIARKNRILSQSTGPLFDPATDAAIRAAFNIYI
jgi:trimethylamine--corrinoid protein Co-methyltransferase